MKKVLAPYFRNRRSKMHKNKGSPRLFAQNVFNLVEGNFDFRYSKMHNKVRTKIGGDEKYRGTTGYACVCVVFCTREDPKK